MAEDVSMMDADGSDESEWEYEYDANETQVNWTQWITFLCINDVY